MYGFEKHCNLFNEKKRLIWELFFPNDLGFAWLVLEGKTVEAGERKKEKKIELAINSNVPASCILA